MTVAKPETAPAPKAPSLWTKLAYGFGSVAYGVKDNGFSYFLLLFYSQVVGVDARLVGLALTIALMLDALIDPVIGFWSDNFHSKWGRRHPFMFASILPAALLYYSLFNPPAGLGQTGELVWLCVMNVMLLQAMTLFRSFGKLFGRK